MSAGRPTKYNKKILTDTIDYIENHADYEDLVPSVAGLAYQLGIRKSTVYEWAKDEGKKEFSDMLAQILAKQEKMLLSGGLSADMNATIVKLMLSKHNYSDKVETDITSKGEKLSNTFNFIPVGPDD
jgi:hypothetical protein